MTRYRRKKRDNYLNRHQESLEHFHEIFRPDGMELISMRNALDMDYELGSRLEGKRQAEIQQLFDQAQPPETEREICDVMVVCVDATKVRVKLKEWVDAGGQRRYETEFRDAKIATVSALGWNAAKDERSATSTPTSVASSMLMSSFAESGWR